MRTSEREYSRKMAELNKGFDVRTDTLMQCATADNGGQSVGSTFSSMESKMNEVGRTAIRIGEGLPRRTPMLCPHIPR